MKTLISVTMVVSIRLITLSVLFLFPIFSLGYSPESPTDWHILVLVDDLAIKSSHSILFKTLTDHGFDLDFKLAHDPKLTLQRYDEYLYDGLILFTPSVDSKLCYSPFNRSLMLI